MEGRIARSLMVVCVLLVLLSGNFTAASFPKCYAACMFQCATSIGTILPLCPFQCFKQCKLPSTAEETQQQFCNLGCAFSMCANISSKFNPGFSSISPLV
uniref:Thionin-like protein 2 n=1 Tax=Rhizophora mucronata TaxID=61149 RepID=A0A2P2LKW5_RHIMU